MKGTRNRFALMTNYAVGLGEPRLLFAHHVDHLDTREMILALVIDLERAGAGSGA